MSKRGQFVTKTGAIAASVGSAVGLGNIWRFPYEAGVHGGGAFLLIYIVCVFAIGVPVMLSEFVVGRGTHSGPKGALRALAPGSPVSNMAYIGIFASMMILSFYSVVAGWIMEYLYQSIVGLFSASESGDYAGMFRSFVANPWRPAVWTVIFLLINLAVMRRGVEKGIEKISNLLMPALFVLLVIFAVNSLLLPDAGRGLAFLFKPDFSQVTSSVVIGAMGQAFFSLSLGLSCMLTYSSYFSDKTPLVRSASTIAILDTLVALLAGVMIFPAVFSYGMEPASGPKLVFEIFPAIFARMPGGEVWSIAFFALLFFAALTSTISMSEISISFFIEEHRMSRPRATGITIGTCIFFGVLCALSFGVLNDFRLFGKTIFDLFDYVSSNIMLPIGGIFFSLFVGWKVSKTTVEQQLTNDGSLHLRVLPLIIFCIRYVAPTAIAVIFISGLL